MRPARRPRPLAESLRRARAEAAPLTPLASVQDVWRDAVGERIAAEAEPVAERDGVVTVECSAATWAQELDLLQVELLEKLAQRLGAGRVERLRFVASGQPRR